MKKETLHAYVKKIEVANTHCHHLKEDFFAEISLHKLLQMTYVSWICPPLPDTVAGRLQYFRLLGANSYFYWWKMAVEEIYGEGQSLTPETWEYFDEKVKKAYDNSNVSLQLLQKKCQYKYILLDDYKNPSANHNQPKWFCPVFRCDMFLDGNTVEGKDQNSNSAYDYFHKNPRTFKEYIEQTQEAIAQAKERGVVALKIAIAYERSLAFKKTSYENASRAFANHRASEEEVLWFQDYMMFEIAKIAALLDLPIQIHTGLGMLKQSRAIYLRELIVSNPSTKFDLFHGSYPWSDDILGLAHTYKNVYIDLCWLPLISPARAVVFLKEALELVDASRIMWGCDTWTGEESYGAILAIRHCLLSVMEDFIQRSIITETYAQEIINMILFENAVQLFKLE